MKIRCFMSLLGSVAIVLGLGAPLNAQSSDCEAFKAQLKQNVLGFEFELVAKNLLDAKDVERRTMYSFIEFEDIGACRFSNSPFPGETWEIHLSQSANFQLDSGDVSLPMFFHDRPTITYEIDFSRIYYTGLRSGSLHFTSVAAMVESLGYATFESTLGGDVRLLSALPSVIFNLPHTSENAVLLGVGQKRDNGVVYQLYINFKGIDFTPKGAHR